MLDQLHCAIMEKGGDNALIDKCKIVQSVFVNLNDDASSADVASAHCQTSINEELILLTSI